MMHSLSPFRTALVVSAIMACSVPAFAQEEDIALPTPKEPTTPPPATDELQSYRDILATAETPEATPDKASSASSPATELNPWSSFGLLFLGTALVCMGGYGFMRRQNTSLKRHDKDLQHLKTLKLGTNHQVSVVSVLGEKYVLGLSQGNIQLLTKLEEEVEQEAPVREVAPAVAPARPRHAPTPRPRPARARVAEVAPQVTEHSGLFEGFEDMDPGLFEEDEPVAPRTSAPPEPMSRPKARDESLESDSVLIALRAFKEQSERI